MQHAGDDEGIPKYPAREDSGNADEKKMAEWIKEQRKKFRQERLSRSQEDLLNALPGWQWAERDMPWKHWYDQIFRWLDEKPEKRCLGDLHKRTHTGKKEQDMAKFLAQQKEAYRRKCGRFMSTYQRRELEKLEGNAAYDMFLPRGNDVQWEDYYKALVWWGDNVAGNKLPNEIGKYSNHMVNSPSVGWLDLGNWLSWTLGSLKRDC